ncbi:uncharacterized protein LOC131043644 [Cryptomeria japonica]|uniref:uncharacterized protein LOC131043644 n=1 Tax=Cryptomeria japonica TaxID=3369 RepID=UPI0027DAA396|nr:uncharacterized protein LOC131043644 [Cryptomeria japonica]
MGNYFLYADDEFEVVPEIEDVILLDESSSDCESIAAESVGSSTPQEQLLNFDIVSVGDPNDVWALEFDGSCSSTGSGAGIVFVSLDGKMFPFFFKLQFDNTNNIAEYESLLLGMNVAQKKGIKNLHAQGDVELIVFNDDQHVINFLQTADNFDDLYFDGSQYPSRDAIESVDVETGEKFLQLKGNKIPKGLVSLEKLFDKHDRYVKKQQKSAASTMEYEQQYIDVLAYSYDDLKSFRPKELCDDIPLKFGFAPFHQKQRQYNPKISDTIFAEIQKMLKKNKEGVESPIAFMSYPLKTHEKKFSAMEKHAFAVVKAIKHFRFYILNSHVTALVPDVVVKSILTQQEFGTKRGNWFVGKPKLAALSLKPVVIEEPFQLWGLDFVGPVNPSSSVGHMYILTAIDYFTKWVEAIPTKQATSAIIIDFCFDYGITLSHSSDYYPQGNGQAESSNKNLVTIIRKLVDEKRWTWHKTLYDALLADRITPKRAIDMSPFQLLYGMNAEIPITLELLALKLDKAVEDETYQGSLDKWIMFLSQLEETRAEVVDRIATHQSQVKALFDKKATSREFAVGDQVLLWDKRREPKGMHGKFDSL